MSHTSLITNSFDFESNLTSRLLCGRRSRTSAMKWRSRWDIPRDENTSVRCLFTYLLRSRRSRWRSDLLGAAATPPRGRFRLGPDPPSSLLELDSAAAASWPALERVFALSRVLRDEEALPRGMILAASRARVQPSRDAEPPPVDPRPVTYFNFTAAEDRSLRTRLLWRPFWGKARSEGVPGAMVLRARSLRLARSRKSAPTTRSSRTRPR